MRRMTWCVGWWPGGSSLIVLSEIWAGHQRRDVRRPWAAERLAGPGRHRGRVIWPVDGPALNNHAIRRTVSLGTGLSCLSDRDVPGQSPSLVVRECPRSTRLDPSIGHATLGARRRRPPIRRPSPYHVDSGSMLNCCDAGQGQFRCRRVAGPCLRFPLRSGTRLARSNLLIRSYRHAPPD